MIEEIILRIKDFLGTSIYKNNVFDFDFWHIVHFIDGAVLMFLILRFIKKWDYGKKIFLFMAILVLNEVVEWAFSLGGSHFFNETKFNILSDLFIGMIGGYLVLHYMSKKKSSK